MAWISQTASGDWNIASPESPPRCSDDIGGRNATSDECNIRPSVHSQSTISRSTQAPLRSLEDAATKALHHGESTLLSNASELGKCSDFQSGWRHASHDTRTLSTSDADDTSDLSELSDISGLSEVEKGETIPIVSNAGKEESVPRHGHKVNVERSPDSPAPQPRQLQTIKPMSKQNNFGPSISPSMEATAIEQLSHNHTLAQSCEVSSRLSPNGDGFIEFELSEFSIYLPDNKFQPFSMRGLQHLGTRSNNIRFLFDGILSLGTTSHYVQDVPFQVRSIGNYGEDLHVVGHHIWIQSEMNAETNKFYRLGKPSAQYARFHDEFIWLADFAKHFVDYLQASDRPISLHRFRRNFYEWLFETHSISSEFQEWYKRYNKEDFRSAVSVNIAFLFTESMGVNPNLESHPVWSEVMSQDSVPKQEIEEQETIVTKYVYECFKDIRFGHHLKVILSTSFSSTPKPSIMTTAESTQHNLGEKSTQSPSSAAHSIVTNQSVSLSAVRLTLDQDIKIGDVLSVTKDGTQSVWKDETSRWKVADDCWYVYVQKVYPRTDGKSTYDVIWLYRPSDTSCAKMKYPYPKELFMSDNCTCLRTRIAADEVLGIVPVQWYGQPSEAGQGYFIRQTYLQNERFVTLEEQHKICEHLRGQPNTSPSKLEPVYPVGSTVLVPARYKPKHGLEPFEIDSYVAEGVKQIAVIRRLLRRQEFDNSGEKNELIYTDEFEKVPTHKIQRTCLVRFYKESDVSNQTIPVPYNRKGNGNAFYITTRLVEKNGKKILKPIGATIPKSLAQGFDPLDPPARTVLDGLDLFCGGGNFGRGLEEGGAVRNRWAVDIDKNAIHTYNANLDESDPTKLFYGSVNDMLAQAMKGNPKSSDLIPLRGEVDFISAGSPCQGFSNLNNEPNNEKGLRNQSLVASVAAYIDFYRPKYGVLENVLSMAKKGRGRDEDVMSQLICAIVGMGYQVQLSVLDAWSFGSPQSRGRLFLTFAAPGLKPMEHPELSHSHPPSALSRGLGKLANGQAFGVRRSGPTPFEWVTLEESVSDLPALGDGATYQCIPFPDHVMVGTLTEQLRRRIESIPIQPRGMNFYKAWNEGRGPMIAEELEQFPPIYKKDGTMRAMYKPQSRAYTRVDPKGIFPCMTVAVSPGDIVMGYGIHWDEQRMLTAMEGRRIQNVPEHEVFLGSPNEVWKILGNSVNRNVSLALGLSLRNAWLANEPAIYRPPVLSEAAALELGKSWGISLPSRSQMATRSKTIRSSTGRGVRANNILPFPPQTVDSSDDENGLTEWTCNFMMSLDRTPSVDFEPALEPATNFATASRTVETKESLKRTHNAFREIIGMPNRRKNKSPRMSSTSPGRDSHINSARSSREAHEKSASRRSAGLSNLQQVAGESLRQIDHGLTPSQESNQSADSDLEVISASVVTRAPSRDCHRPRRHRRKLPSRPRRNQPPIFIDLLSDNDDGDVFLQTQRLVQTIPSIQQQKRNEFHPTASPPYQLGTTHADRVEGSRNQRHRLPNARPILIHERPYCSKNKSAERCEVQPRHDSNSITIGHTSGSLSAAANSPSLSNHPAADISNDELHHQDLRNEIVRRETMDTQVESREIQTNDTGTKAKGVTSTFPPPKYVPVDNGGFMAYFQTSRYMGKKSATGNGRVR